MDDQMIRPWIAVILIILAASATIPQALAEEGKVRVELSAEPEECALALQGAGTYSPGDQVTISVSVKPGCRFVKWVVEYGLPVKEVSVNPFTFFAEKDFKAVAVLERLYEKPGGEVIERVIVYFSANASVELPKPMIVRPGEAVRVSFQKEVLRGDEKYVYLYAEDTLGNRYASNEIALTVNESMTIMAYYYAYKRFLDQYYPSYLFVPVRIPSIKEGEGVRLRAVGFKIANQTFSLDTKVPKPLLNLVEPEYVREYRLAVSVYGADVDLAVNDRRVRVRSGRSQTFWIKEGETFLIEAPEQTMTHELKPPSGNFTYNNGHIFGRLKEPTSITLIYAEKPNAFLLNLLPDNVPAPIRYLPFQLAEFGSAMGRRFGLEISGFPAMLMPILLLAAVGVGGYQGYRALRGFSLPRRRVEGGAVSVAFTAGVVTPRRATAIQRHRVYRGRIRLDEELRARAAAVGEEVMGGTEEEPMPVEVFFDERVKPQLDSLWEALVNWKEAEVEPSIITRLRLDETLLEGLKMGIAEGRIRLRDRLGPLGYYEESIRLRLMLLERGYPCVQIAAADRALARYVALDACADAGLRMGIYSGGFRSTNHRALASEVNKIASRLRCDAILVENVAPDDIRLLAKAALMSRPSIIAVYEAEVLPDSIYLDPRGKASSEEEWYARIAIALASAKDLINGLGWEEVQRIGRMASAFRGVATIERFLDILAKTGDASQALRETYSIGLDEAFTPAELQLLSSEPDVETLHDRYTAMIRQLKPGADPELEWVRFYERLRKLGLVEVGEGE